MPEAVKKHVTQQMVDDVKYQEQNIWSRVDMLSGSRDASYPELRRQVNELAGIWESYLERWETLRAAMQADGSNMPPTLGLLSPLCPAFKREA